MSNLDHRVVEPELLDSLPFDHPDARHSRRDLRLLNGIMGNFRWIARTLEAIPDFRDRTICELGAGDGSLGEYLQRRIFDPRFRVTGLDLAPQGRYWPELWPWIEGNALETMQTVKPGVMVANLILHHFSEPELAGIGQLFQRADYLIISEPARYRRHHFQGHLANILGINRVTRHDLHVSIRAGFRPGELPALLELKENEWRIQETHDFWGAYRLYAERIDGA